MKAIIQDLINYFTMCDTGTCKIDRLIVLNHAIFLVWCSSMIIVNPNINTSGFIVFVLGVIGLYLLHRGKAFGYVIFLIQSLLYANIAISYSMIGDFYSNSIISVVFNVMGFIMAVPNLRDDLNKLMKVKPKRRSKIFQAMKYLLLILVYILIRDWLTDTGSLFPTYESANIVLMILAFRSMYNNSSEQWVFWFCKAFIGVIIWFSINDREYILYWYVFYLIHCVLKLIQNKDRINGDLND